MTDTAGPTEGNLHCILSDDVEKRFLPGLCGASSALRRSRIDYAVRVVSAKQARQLQQATVSWLPGRASTGAPALSGHGHYVEHRGEAYLTRLRRHSAYSALEHARDLVD